MAHLVVIVGKRRGAVLELERAQRLGRDREAEVRLVDDKISRLHAEIVREAGAWVVRDLSSRNGTLINGVRCDRGVLHNGDELQLGRTTLVFVDEAGDGLSTSGAGVTIGDGETRIDPEGGPMIGESAVMQEVHRLLIKAARAPATVLITGESGTGKELAAQAIHRASPRRDGPLVALNCSTLHGDLLNSELFGHEKGAFTGAADRRIGAFERAAGGTLFLDEVGELPAETQAALLRIVEGKGFTRVGGSERIVPDARLIAATHRDLKAAAGEGRFREDLYYRLAVVEVCLPPLRERGDDVRQLAEFFLERCRRKLPDAPRRFEDDALARLVAHPFPGNVRELRNIVERLAILVDGATIQLADLPDEVCGAGGGEALGETRPHAAGDDTGSFPSLHEVERVHIERALELTGGNKARAARLLGIDRATLYNRLKKYADQ